jgi:hypothetical protein
MIQAIMISNATDNCHGRTTMPAKTTRVLIDRELADKAVRALGAKSKTEAARIAVEWIVGSGNFCSSRSVSGLDFSRAKKANKTRGLHSLRKNPTF